GSPGGAILNTGANLTLADAVITGSSVDAADGGGIYNTGTLTVTRCTLEGNSAVNGGGIYNTDTLRLTDTTLAGNRADVGTSPDEHYGGGIYNSGTAVLTNCTFRDNVAGFVSPILRFSGGGGAILNSGALTLLNSTVSFNAAWEGGGVLNSDTG